MANDCKTVHIACQSEEREADEMTHSLYKTFSLTNLFASRAKFETATAAAV